MNIKIINYGMGNIASVVNMVKKIGFSPTIAMTGEDLHDADKIILPGVGAFDHGMERLTELKFLPFLTEKANKDKTPILGICLGMQLMTQKSEEGILPGLGWVNAQVKRFSFSDNTLKVPHMGWNYVNYNNKGPTHFAQEPPQRYYFVHSYYVCCNDEKARVGYTRYGFDFCSIFIKENLWGVQFHPEKSHQYGMRLIRSFLENT